ncbi:MAG: asparaginase, partial [Armatimonadetes bacterium]|nr:asparaginase [Armatimonadota bacterium]
GIAMKIADGSGRPLSAITLAALEAVGGLSPTAASRLERFRRPAIHNCHGTHVGDVVATLKLEAIAHE